MPLNFVEHLKRIPKLKMLLTRVISTEISSMENTEGCWDGNHAVMQLEDVAELFFTLLDKALHQLVLEIDHS